MAARYTDDRRDNFDIYLPVWLARYNKLIFGPLYFVGVAFALARWIRAPGQHPVNTLIIAWTIFNRAALDRIPAGVKDRTTQGERKIKN